MTQKLNYLKETASQTAGPYVHIGLAPIEAGFDLQGPQIGQSIAGPDAAGERILIEGTVLDGTGAVVKDVLIEVWQADATGQYHEKPVSPSGFRGWGRTAPDFGTGIFAIETVKPGAVSLPDGGQMAPHLCLWLVARGINTGLHTRIYFEDERSANATDPVLALIEQDHRRDTLIARQTPSGYRFDIVLQGEAETVFLDV